MKENFVREMDSLESEIRVLDVSIKAGEAAAFSEMLEKAEESAKKDGCKMINIVFLAGCQEELTLEQERDELEGVRDYLLYNCDYKQTQGRESTDVSCNLTKHI